VSGRIAVALAPDYEGPDATSIRPEALLWGEADERRAQTVRVSRAELARLRAVERAFADLSERHDRLVRATRFAATLV
jgi:hypothetical protein